MFLPRRKILSWDKRHTSGREAFAKETHFPYTMMSPLQMERNVYTFQFARNRWPLYLSFAAGS